MQNNFYNQDAKKQAQFTRLKILFLGMSIKNGNRSQ